MRQWPKVLTRTLPHIAATLGIYHRLWTRRINTCITLRLLISDTNSVIVLKENKPRNISMAALRLPRALSARLTHVTHTRAFTTTIATRSGWKTGPAPPRLPKEDQAIFEDLQRQSSISGAFSQPKQPSATETASVTPQINQSPLSQPEQETEAQINARVEADGEGEELHPNVRRGAKPEFEGDVNPKTGEVGGPKNEPLRWGHGGDWSYNGRCTDF